MMLLGSRESLYLFYIFYSNHIKNLKIKYNVIILLTVIYSYEIYVYEQIVFTFHCYNNENNNNNNTYIYIYVIVDVIICRAQNALYNRLTVCVCVSIQRQSSYSANGRCGPRQVCCRRPPAPPIHTGSSSNLISSTGQCGKRNTNGITGRIKTPSYVDGDSEFGKLNYYLKQDSLTFRRHNTCRNFFNYL